MIDAGRFLRHPSSEVEGAGYQAEPEVSDRAQSASILTRRHLVRLGYSSSCNGQPRRAPSHRRRGAPQDAHHLLMDRRGLQRFLCALRPSLCFFRVSCGLRDERRPPAAGRAWTGDLRLVLRAHRSGNLCADGRCCGAQIPVRTSPPTPALARFLHDRRRHLLRRSPLRHGPGGRDLFRSLPPKRQPAFCRSWRPSQPRRRPAVRAGRAPDRSARRGQLLAAGRSAVPTWVFS